MQKLTRKEAEEVIGGGIIKELIYIGGGIALQYLANQRALEEWQGFVEGSKAALEELGVL